MRIPDATDAGDRVPMDNGEIGIGMKSGGAPVPVISEDKAKEVDEDIRWCANDEPLDPATEDVGVKVTGSKDVGITAADDESVSRWSSLTEGAEVLSRLKPALGGRAVENSDPTGVELWEGKASLVMQLARWFRSLVFSSISSSLFESRYLLTSCAHAWYPSW